MAVGDDTQVDFTAQFNAEEAAARARQFADGVKSDLLSVGATPGEVRLQTATAEAALGELTVQSEELRQEILSPSILAIDTGAAFGELELVTEAAASLKTELAEAGAQAAALPIAEPFLAAEPAVAGLRESVAGLGEGLATLPAEVNPALEQINAAFLSAEGAVERFEVKAVGGSKRIAQPMTAARVAVIQLKEAIASLGPESGESVEILEGRLRQLEARIDSGSEAWGRFRAQARITSIELKEAAIAAGAAHGSIDDLVDGSLAKFPRMEKAVFSAVSALTVLQLAYSETRHLVEKIKDIGGPDIDEGIQRGVIWLLEETTLQHKADLALLDDKAHLLALDRLLAAHQAELTEAKITYVHTIESETKALEALEEYHQSAQVIGRQFVETILQSSEAVDKERRALELGLPILRERGVFTAASSDLIISRLNAEIEAMKRLGESTSELEKVRDGFEQMSRKLKLEAETDGLRKFADQVAASGRVTTELADKIAAEATKIVKAIRELPPEEQKAMQERLSYLERLRDGYDKFTSAHAALLKKQEENARKEAEAEAQILKRREDQTRTFLESLRGLLAKPLTGPSITGGDDHAKALADAKAELAALQKKSGEGFVSGDELNRMGELQDKIAQLGAEFGSLTHATHSASSEQAGFGAAGQAAAEKAREALVTLLGKSEEFSAALKAMSPAMRAELLQISEGFLSDLGGGLVKGEEDIAAFVGRFTGILQASGAVSSKFGVEMAAAFGQGTSSLEALFNAASGMSSGLQDAQGEITILRTSMGEFVAGAAETTETTKQATAATVDHNAASQEATTGYIRRSAGAKEVTAAVAEMIAAHKGEAESELTAALRRTEGAEKLKQEAVEIKNYTREATNSTVELVNVNKEAAESAHLLSDGLGLLPEQINQVTDELTPVNVGLQLFRENLQASGPLVGIFQQPAVDAAKLAESAPKAAEGVGSVGKVAGETAPLLKALTTEMGADAEAAGKMRSAVQGLRGDLAALNTILAETVKLCGALAKCRAGGAPS